MKFIFLLTIVAVSSARKLEWLERQRRNSDDSLLNQLTSSSSNSHTDLQSIYDRMYAEMFQSNPDDSTTNEQAPTPGESDKNETFGETTQNTDFGSNVEVLRSLPDSNQISSVIYDGPAINIQSGEMTGSAMNKGAATGENYYVIHNDTYIEAASSGNGTAGAATRSDVSLTDGGNGDNSGLTVRGNVAATGSSTLVRSISSAGGDNTGSQKVAGVQIAVASGTSQSSSSTSLLISPT